MKKYTIEQQGDVWIASNGTNHVEGEDASDALYLLESGEVEAQYVTGQTVESGAEQRRIEAIEQKLQLDVLVLINLAGGKVPATIMRNQLAVIKKSVENYIAAHDLDD